MPVLPFVLATALSAPAVLLGVNGGSSQSAGLAAAAAASGRPRECLSGSRRALAHGPSIWEAAREPNLERYCDLVARAQAELATRPEAAKASATEADTTLPGRAAPTVLLGRALLALGKLDDADAAFEKARSIDARSVEEPMAMHAFARVLAKRGKLDGALAVYRALVPRIDLLGTPSMRIAVLLEAAHVSMAVVGQKNVAGTKPKLDEAIAYLREARLRPTTELSTDVLISLALTLDREDEREQADAVLADAERATEKPRIASAEYVAKPEDKQALEAMAAFFVDRPLSQKGWEAFLSGAGGKGPWSGEARARVELLKRGGGARPAKKGGAR